MITINYLKWKLYPYSYIFMLPKIKYTFFMFKIMNEIEID